MLYKAKGYIFESTMILIEIFKNSTIILTAILFDRLSLGYLPRSHFRIAYIDFHPAIIAISSWDFPLVS